MPDNKKDVFKILEDIEKLALGISDSNPKGLDGFIASLMPSGEAVDAPDYAHPWKPNMTSPNNVTPPPQPGSDPSVPDTSGIAKRYESLANTCTLVDRKLQLNEVYQAITTGASISEAWEIIIS